MADVFVESRHIEIAFSEGDALLISDVVKSYEIEGFLEALSVDLTKNTPFSIRGMHLFRQCKLLELYLRISDIGGEKCGRRIRLYTIKYCESRADT
jgi:hypothetical protein